jgi:hypothetical protein
MGKLRFRGVIEMNGINPFVQVSAERAARVRKGWRKPMPMLVRVNGQPEKAWRINMMPAGDGSFYLYLHGEVRKAAGTKAGDFVTVELEFDGDYKNGPMHPMPAWFREALAKNLRARKAWTALSPSRKKELLRYFAGLKSTEAQVRNLQRAIHVLSGGKARFMGRAWNEE